MTTQLPERLRSLADDAPGPLSPVGLWHAGRRRHRRRVVTAAAVVGAVVALTAGAGFGDYRSRRPDPAAPPATNSGPMAIPDRFYEPSPWLPSTSKPGRLVAVIEGVTQQHVPWGSSNDRVVGIAAGSQRYSFIDLPERASESDVALAPDGHHLAYWLDGPSNAVGVLDVTTGRLERHPVLAGEHLLDENLRWTGASTLAVEANWPVVKHAENTFGEEALALTLGSPRVHSLPLGTAFGDGAVAQPSGLAIMASQRAVDVLDPDTGRIIQHISLSRRLPRTAALDASATRIASALETNRPGALVVGRVRHGHVDLAPVPGDRTYAAVLGWADASHVVADRTTGHVELVRVDVKSGRFQTLSRLDAAVEIAGEALQHPVVAPSVVPPRPWNRRPILAWSMVALALLGWGVFLVRFSRVRR